MAEPIVEYTVEVGFDAATRKLQEFQKKMGAFETKQAKATKTSQAMMNAHHKEREKHLNKEYNNKLKREKELSRAHVAAIKQNIRFNKQASMPPRMEQRRITNLSTAKEAFQRSGLNLRGATNANEIAAQAALREAVAKATTAKEVRLIMAMERERLRVLKQAERSMNKQNFLMQRMTASSKQFAGNMFSAFAVAGVTAGVTKVGQDFEAVNNTMLAVSKDSIDAGNNFKFVRDEAYRLGLGLTESAKGYAKMLAAKGTLKKSEIEGLFTGVSELSTVLGLTAEESNRATNAITQMLSKGKISAEELRLQLG